LSVENPVAMGVDKKNSGDILILDTIEGKDYKKIILEERKKYLEKK